MFGFTGEYEGMPVSVQTTGMGGPSAAIVCEELIMLGAKFFIRIGTCGAIHPKMNPGDLLLVTGACMSDGTSKELIQSHMSGSNLDMGYPATSDFEFIAAAREEAIQQKIPYHLGKVASLDRFYGHTEETYQKMAQIGIDAVEMEVDASKKLLYVNRIKFDCKELGKKFNEKLKIEEVKTVEEKVIEPKGTLDVKQANELLIKDAIKQAREQELQRIKNLMVLRGENAAVNAIIDVALNEGAEVSEVKK